MKLKPLADRVVVKQIKAEEKTKGGIILTTAAQEKPEVYEVLVVGPGGMVDGNEVKMEVKAGDKVIMGKYTGTTVKLDGEEYIQYKEVPIDTLIFRGTYADEDGNICTDEEAMVLEVFLQYQIQSENVVKIATEYGNLDALQARIETVTIEKTKAVMSSAEAMTIIQNRSQFSNSVSASVREGISDDYYVNVKDVVLTNIDFTNEFERSVEDKVIAEQEKQAAITRAEAELEVAKLEAQKKIEEARGNAEAQKIIAQASAEAATYNIVELAKTVGYTVNETYLYSVEGVEREFAAKQAESETTIYLGTKYVIDLTSGPGQDQFKVLVEDYLKYLAYLEKWNGELPDVVSGDDALSIIVPNS